MQVTAYQDKRGNIHLKQSEQVKADTLIDLEESMKKSSRWYSAKLQINSIEELTEFLNENRAIIKKALEVI